MLKEQTRQYLLVLIISQILIFSVTSLVTHLGIQSISDQTSQKLLETAEDHMRERVNHMLTCIENERAIHTKEVASFAEMVADSIQKESGSPYDQALLWSQHCTKAIHGSVLRILLYTPETQKAQLFAYGIEQSLTAQEDVQAALAEIERAPVCQQIDLAGSQIYVFALQEEIDVLAKNEVYDVIYSYVYGDDGYVWVNEVLDYNGGDNYAVRRIHPNLTDTEGIYLSTNMTDVMGNYPYQAELDGINENGEIFHTYYFKNLSNDNIEEKASYAKLYEPFDWIVATGEPLSDVLAYAEELSLHNRTVSQRTLLLNLLLAGLFVLNILLIIFQNRRYNQHVAVYIREETEQDVLTRAFTRKAGEIALHDALRDFQENGINSLLFMIDIDDFKQINDTYGHDAGDVVLKTITAELMSNIRKSDGLYRWGGEEFVLLLRKNELTVGPMLARKFLKTVNSLKFESEGNTFSVSISIGGACFAEGDEGYEPALKRADKALYCSKHNGKNCYTSSDEMEARS